MFRPRMGLCGAILFGFALLVAGSSLPLRGQGQSPASGQDVFEKRCGGCHALDQEREGPRLRGVYGRMAAAVESFDGYSDALKKSKIIWDESSLDKWLTDTEQLVPNNNMAFRVPNADERRAIIAYLKQVSGK